MHGRRDWLLVPLCFSALLPLIDPQRAVVEHGEPLLLSIQPGLSCQSGGAVVRLSGRNFTPNETLAVQLAGVRCHVINITDELITCRTGALPGNMVVQPRVINGATVLHENQVVLFANNGQHSLKNTQFRYTKDPHVNNMFLLRGVWRHGAVVHVEGDNLHVVEKPEMQWSISKNATNMSGAFQLQKMNRSEKCHLGRPDGTLLLCPVPNITALMPVQETDCEEMTLEANVWLHMDDVKTGHWTTEADGRRFQLYPEPTYRTFGRIRTFEKDQQVLVLEGRHLNSAVHREDTQVTVGQWPCAVTNVSSCELICIPAVTPIAEEELLAVTVIVGNISFAVGLLRVLPLVVPDGAANPGPQQWMIIVVVLSGLLLFAIAAYFCYCRRQRAMGRGIRPLFGLAAVGRRRVLVSTNPSYVSLERALQGPPSSCPGVGALHVRSPEGALCSTDGTIDRKRLTLGDLLSQGRFGRIYRGSLVARDDTGQPTRMEVAVKASGGERCCHQDVVDETGRRSMPDAARRPFDLMRIVEEGLVMQELSHENVLALVGICFSDVEGPLLLLPAMPHGDLASYIRDEQNEPTLRNLITFGVDVARGMAYLSAVGVVHRSLTAQNCTLDEQLRVKIANFAVCCHKDDQSHCAACTPHEEPLIRWTAPEVLSRRSFSSKATVWSFGVVLWELMTRGMLPYHELDTCWLVKYVRSGGRLLQPDYCPDVLYAIMMRCWDKDPALRPAFEHLQHDVAHVITYLERIRDRLQRTSEAASQEPSDGTECRAAA